MNLLWPRGVFMRSLLLCWGVLLGFIPSVYGQLLAPRTDGKFWLYYSLEYRNATGGTDSALARFKCQAANRQLANLSVHEIWQRCVAGIPFARAGKYVRFLPDSI